METNQEPTPTPVPFDLNALLLTALAPVVQHMTAPLLARIAVLEERIDGATLTPLTHEYIAKVARESVAEVSDERIKEIAEEVAEAAIYEHNDEYDHDEYDRLENKIDDMVSEAIKDFDMEDKLRDTFRDMTFSITARY